MDPAIPDLHFCAFARNKITFTPVKFSVPVGLYRLSTNNPLAGKRTLRPFLNNPGKLYPLPIIIAPLTPEEARRS